MGYINDTNFKVLILTSFVILFLIITGFFQTFPTLSEPTVVDNFDGTLTANWTLDDPMDYDIYNLTMENGAVNLTLNSFWWNQTTQLEFETGTMYNINTSGFPGDLTLNSTAFGIGQNLIKNSNFSTNQNWSFDSSANITSEWHSSGEYGSLWHYSPSNPPIFGEQNVSNGNSDGDAGGSSAINVIDALQYIDDGKWWRVDRSEYIDITGFNVVGRSGNIIRVILWARHRVESAQYDGGDGSSGNSSLQYRDESATFRNTTIIPDTNTTWKNQFHDITSGFSSWTWSDIENLEVRFVNPDDSNPDAYVEFDRIWLEVTVEGFDQTAYINQTFEVFNATGFNDTLYEDFIKNMENNYVNFTSEPDSVILDYTGSSSVGQFTLYANDTGGNGTWIYAQQNNNNYGGSPVLWVGGDTRTRTLLRFNISNIPPGAIINNAVLELWVEWVVDDIFPFIPVAVYKMDKDWDEGTQDTEIATDGVTWDYADTNPLIDWEDGGEFDPTIQYNISALYPSDENAYYGFNITTLVQEWINGSPNYGLLLNDTVDGTARSVRFASDDGLNLSRAPRLVINYEVPHHYTYGNYSSQIFDAETTINNWGSIGWNGETPLGTAIAIETRTSPDNIIWSPWSGNYTTSGDGITSPSGRYIQYRAHLETTNIHLSPTLHDVTIIFKRTNLTFDRIAEALTNATEAEMSIAINDTVVWRLNSESPWTTELVDISEWIVEKGFFNISLRFHLIIETEDEVNCSVGYDNVIIGSLGNESRGEYISIGFDTGSKAIWDTISWNPSLPADTSIIIQTRTSSDNSSWGLWSNAYSTPLGDVISSPNDRYIQYRATLITMNETRNPRLSDVNISYHKYCWNGTLEMNNDFSPGNLTSWGTFTPEQSGDNITFWYSLDSSMSWALVPSNGDMSSISILTGTIRFRANFTTMDTIVTPTLYGFTLRYQTNNFPELLNGDYFNEPGGFGEGWFNFSVIYQDADNDYPALIKLTLTGDHNYNITMNDLQENDFDVTDGKWFYYNITLPKGSYQYRFIAFDGKSWNSTSFVSFMVNNNPPTLLYPDVEPNTGPGGTTFNFTVAYFDKDNDAPQQMNIDILGPVSLNISMSELDPSDTSYNDGKDYHYLLILPKGTYTYFFNASDGEVWSSIGPFLLEVGNNPPELTLAQVTPSSGYVNTSFNFTVTYTDIDDDPPGNITLNLTGPSYSGSYIMMEVDPGDMNYADGKSYYLQITGLTKGFYSFHFAANDSDGEWTETTQIPLPEVLNAIPQILTSDVFYVDEDSFYCILYEYSDIDNDSCIWFLDSNASWLSIDLNTGYLNGTPDNGDVGWFWINVTLSDNDGGLNWTYFILTVNNTSPYITTTSPTQWAVEGYLYSFDFDGEDEGEGNAYWDRVTNASWLQINSSNGMLFGTPGANDVGSYWVNITLYDGNGGSDSLNFTITVNDISPPMADAGLDGFTWVGVVYMFDGSGSTDNSGIISNYTWYFGDGTVGYDVSPTHSYTNKGLYQVVLKVEDPTGNEDYDTINITVRNSDPQILTANVDFVDEDSFYSVQYQYFDIDGDSCIWSYDSNASWLSLNPGTGYLNGTPDNGDVGWFWVNVTLSDNDGGLNWTYFILTVYNTPPQITTTSPTPWAVEGYPYTFDFNGEDEGEGNAFWDRVTNSSWLQINSSNGVVFGTPGANDVGSYWVNITLYDGNGGSNSLNFSLTVSDTSPPIADAGLDGFTWVGVIYIFDGSGSTDNSGIISNYTWHFGDGTVGYGVSPMHIYSNKGSYTVVLKVEDPTGNEDYDTINITVRNSDPQILTANVDFVDEDSFYSVQYQYFDIDGDLCIWSFDSNASWLSLNPGTGYLNGTPDNGDVGWFWVNVTISDNDGGSDWTFFILTVYNTIPQITTTSPNPWASEGIYYSFEFNGEDEGEGMAYWGFNSNSTWLYINSTSGEIYGTPGTLDVGSSWVNVTLYDGNGYYDSLNFSITIIDTSPPTADAGEDSFTWEDAAFTFDGSNSTDNSGTISDYTWYFGDGAVGNGLTPSHIYTNKGIYLIVLFVKDASGNEGFDTMEITVLNPDPIADAGPDITGDEGNVVYFSGSGSYDTPSDNTSLIFLWDFDYDGEYDDGFGMTSSYIWYDEGVYMVGLKVIDNDGNYSTDTLNVIISNLPPTVSLKNKYSGFEGEKIYFLASADDPGSDIFNYRWDWDNDGRNDTKWSDEPLANHTWNLFGTYTIRVEVWDGDNGFTNTTTEVVVIRPEQPPVISGVGGRYVRFDYPFILDLDPYITDPDTPKGDLIVTTSDPTHIKVDGIILTLTYPESMWGQTRVVLITVSDGKNTDNDTLTVTITDNYPPEISGEIPDVIFDEGGVLEDIFDLDNYFTDKDGEPLSYQFIGNEHVIPVVNSPTGFASFSADPNWFGIENITIRAYDPHGAFTQQVIKVTVEPVNFPPTISGIQDVYVRLDTPWELKVLDPVYVWDDDSILDLSLFTDSSFVTPSTSKHGVLVFYYLDPSITSEIVKISISDGEFTASTDVNVHISLLNWPPYIKDYSYPSDVRFDEDTTLDNHFNLNDYFADNETEVLTFTQIIPISNLFVTIDNQGLVSFSASENWFGISTVTFRAQDGSGAWASFTINVTVRSVNDVPFVVQTITYLQIKEDEVWIIDLDDYFDDIESGNNLTYSCNRPDIIIDNIEHEARWERNGKTSLEGVIFSASDGEDSVSMDAVNLNVIVKEEAPFNWLWLIIAAILGALCVIGYRQLRYRYKVEEAFLVNNAGILLAHVSRGESRVSVDIELVSAMLTAVQEFVRDSFTRGETESQVLLEHKKSLEKLEFGGFHLVLEGGHYSFLCAVISGYVNKKLRKRMREVLEEFEDKYEDTLQDWDGIIERFEGTKEIMEKLIKIGGEAEEVSSPFVGMEPGEIKEGEDIQFDEESISETSDIKEEELED